MRIEVSGQTHVGMKRTHNEDNLLLLPEERLVVVADGMGGHASGEIASKIAVEELGDFFSMTSRDEEITWPYKMDKGRTYDENRLATGIKLANRRILDRAASETRLKGMGTTLVSVYFAKDTEALIAHVGDSRVYFYRDGDLRQLTEDHSLLNDYLKAKKLSPEEIESFPHKNVIVRALGMKDSVQVDICRIEPKDNDLFLLCSDGLSGMLTDDQMKHAISHAKDLKKACEELIELANAAGGNDNVTCVLARFHR